MNYFDTDYATINYNSEKNVVHAEWKKYPTEEEFRTALDAMIDAMVKYKSTKLITVTTHLGAISDYNQKWTNEDWFPRAIKIGYNKIAVVVSDDIFNKIAVEDIMSQLGTFESKYFDNEQDALAWI